MEAQSQFISLTHGGNFKMDSVRGHPHQLHIPPPAPHIRQTSRRIRHFRRGHEVPRPATPFSSLPTQSRISLELGTSTPSLRKTLPSESSPALPLSSKTIPLRSGLRANASGWESHSCKLVRAQSYPASTILHAKWKSVRLNFSISGYM